MNTLRVHIFAAAIFAFALSLAPAKASALQWSDNSFHLWSGPGFREPFDPDNITKVVVTYQHVDGYKWGSNFLSADWLFSPSGADDNVQGLKEVGSAGALEVYTVYRHELSLNKISGTKTFEGFIFRDLGIVLGADVGTKNHAFSERKIMPIGGLRVELNVPGFWQFDFCLDKEWGVDGITGQSTDYNITPNFATAWGIPIGPLSFQGFGIINLPKGDGNKGLSNTVTEYLFHPKLMLDVGKLFGSNGYEVGVGYEYWLNKFGNDNSKDPTEGSFAHTVFGEVAIHL